MNLFQLTCFSHNVVFFWNQNARYAGNRCIHFTLNLHFCMFQIVCPFVVVVWALFVRYISQIFVRYQFLEIVEHYNMATQSILVCVFSHTLTAHPSLSFAHCSFVVALCRFTVERRRTENKTAQLSNLETKIGDLVGISGILQSDFG